ncbi:MAG: hypothetical protein KHW46_07215 [Clostridiales bacterium]|nr:hypothetical protein [Clostridiales bacterium]
MNIDAVPAGNGNPKADFSTTGTPAQGGGRFVCRQNHPIPAAPVNRAGKGMKYV